VKRFGSITLVLGVFFGVAAPQADAAPKFAISVVQRADTSGEPGIEIDNRTSPPTVYVVAPEFSSQLWRSTNGGKTFRRMKATDGAGGDSDVVVDANRTVYVSDLDDSGPANLPVSTSTNGGGSYKRKVPVGDTNAGYDRQWNASNGPGHLLMTATGNTLQSWVSTDSARSFAGPYKVTGTSDEGGPVVAGPDHVYYLLYLAPDGIRFAKSADGKHWKNGMVARDHFTSFFPVIAVDDASNLYATWTDESNVLGFATAPVYFARSTNSGRSWSRPRAVSSTTPDAFGTIPSAVFPWIVAGAKGKVAISYVAARQLAGPDLSSDLGGPQTTWDLVVAQSTNALASKPKWTKTVVAPRIHTGSICDLGLFCPSPQNPVIGIGNYPGPFDRRFLDFFEADVDQAGRVYVAFQKDRALTAGTVDDLWRPQTDFLLARQVGGTRLRP
jgi:hypothetical protein